MLLSLWPLFIAIPETANYALIDQRKRDERRLAKKRKQIAEELEEAIRRRNGPIIEDANAGLDGAEYTGAESTGISAFDILGHDGGAGAGRISEPFNNSTRENGTISIGIDNAMKRKSEDEALFLILANL